MENNNRVQRKERILTEPSNRFYVIDMLRHYWYVKGLIDNYTLEKGLDLLSHDKNPFLDENFINKLRINAKEKKYLLSSPALTVKLEGD